MGSDSPGHRLLLPNSSTSSVVLSLLLELSLAFIKGRLFLRGRCFIFNSFLLQSNSYKIYKSELHWQSFTEAFAQHQSL